MHLLFAAILLALILGLGLAVLSVMLDGVRLHPAERVGLSFAAGYGLLGLVLFDLSCCGLVPSRLMLSVIAVAVAVVLLFYRRLLWVRRSETINGEKGVLPRVLVIGSVGLIAVGALNVLAEALTPGVADIDMFGIWMLRAKLLFGRPLLPLPAALTDPTLSYSHQDYPMGMPFVVSAAYALGGRVDEMMANQALLLPIWLALGLILYGALRRRLGRGTAAAVTAALVASPVVVHLAGSAVAELPLVLMHAATLVLLLRWMESGCRRELVACAAFAAFTAFMKNEGMALLPLVGGLGLLFSILRRRAGWVRDWLCAGATVVLLIGPWLVFRRWLPHTHEDYGGRLGSAATLTAALPRAGAVFGMYVRYLWDLQTAGPLWIMLALVAVLFRWAWRELSVRMFWVLAIAHWALYGLIFTITPWPPEVLIPMVGPKLVMHVAPAAVLLIGLHVGGARRREDPTASRLAG